MHCKTPRSTGSLVRDPTMTIRASYITLFNLKHHRSNRLAKRDGVTNIEQLPLFRSMVKLKNYRVTFTAIDAAFC